MVDGFVLGVAGRAAPVDDRGFVRRDGEAGTVPAVDEGDADDEDDDATAPVDAVPIVDDPASVVTANQPASTTTPAAPTAPVTLRARRAGCGSRGGRYAGIR